jgi:hypothetical protein
MLDRDGGIPLVKLFPFIDKFETCMMGFLC